MVLLLSVLVWVCFFCWTRSLLFRCIGQEGQGWSVLTWKSVNTANSLLHALISGAGALICLWLYPETAVDVVNSYSLLAHALAAFSIGYFLYDFGDMLWSHRKRSSYELMIHHSFVLSCFGVSVVSGRYLGFVVVSLLVEVNSVFLHWRQLLLLRNTHKASTFYRCVSLINLLTFIAFRIMTLGWMTRWLVVNKEKVPLPVYALGSVAMGALVFMSCILLLRIIRKDFHANHAPHTHAHAHSKWR